MDEFDGEIAETEDGSRLFGKDLGIIQEVVLFQLQFYQRRRQRRCVDGDVQFPEHIGNGADMVFMTVSQDQAADAGGIVAQISDVGQNHVHPVHIFIREAHAAVYDDDVAPVLKGSHILADLTETAKRDDFKF